VKIHKNVCLHHWILLLVTEHFYR